MCNLQLDPGLTYKNIVGAICELRKETVDYITVHI